MKGKTLKALGLLSLLAVIIFSACQKDRVETQPDAAQATLKSLMSEYETVDLTQQQIEDALINNTSAEKNLVLIPGKYEFKLRNTSPNQQVEIVDMESNTVEKLDLRNSTFDNYENGNKQNFASFSYVDRALHGSFKQNGQVYIVSPVSEMTGDLSNQSYVIYPDDAYYNKEPAEILSVDMSDEEYLKESAILKQMGGASSYKTTSKPLTLTVNTFTNSQFRRACRSNNLDYNCLITSTMLAVNQKFVKANMPVRIKLGRIYHTGKTQIPWTHNIKDQNDKYFGDFLKAKPHLKAPANILFTGVSTDKKNFVRVNSWSVGRPKRRTAKLTLSFEPHNVRRANWIAHELGHMMGCSHLFRHIYGLNVMTPYIFYKEAPFADTTRVMMADYISKFNEGLY